MKGRADLVSQRHTVVCHVSKQLVQAVGSDGINRDERLEKHTWAHLDLLEWSRFKGHPCLKCVLSVQYLYVCVCTCVCVPHTFTV